MRKWLGRKGTIEWFLKQALSVVSHLYPYGSNNGWIQGDTALKVGNSLVTCDESGHTKFPFSFVILSYGELPQATTAQYRNLGYDRIFLFTFTVLTLRLYSLLIYPLIQLKRSPFLIVNTSSISFLTRVN